MGFWDKLRDLFAGSGTTSEGNDPHGVWLFYRCNRCRSAIRIRVDRRNDFNRGDDGPGTYVLRKEVMDDTCFQIIHSEVWFDRNYQVVTADVTGGELISEEEYNALQGPEEAETSDDVDEQEPEQDTVA